MLVFQLNIGHLEAGISKGPILGTKNVKNTPPSWRKPGDSEFPPRRGLSRCHCAMRISTHQPTTQSSVDLSYLATKNTWQRLGPRD